MLELARSFVGRAAVMTLAMALLMAMEREISRRKAPPLRQAPHGNPLTMRMMLGLGLAASLVPKLSLLRSLLVMRATASFVDLAVSKRHLGPWSHNSGRLTTVSYLILVLEPKLRLYEGMYQKLWNCASQATIAIVMTFAKFRGTHHQITELHG
jgi:hypothetical protein